MLNYALLASGGGTTALNIFEATRSGRLVNLVRISALIASKSNIGAISKLVGAGFDERLVDVIDPRDFGSQKKFGEEIIGALEDTGSDSFGQHGWLPLTPKNVIERYPDRGVNQHPAGLDPHPTIKYMDFGGKGMYGCAAVAAQLYFARLIDRPFHAEATAHVVTENFDEGLLVHTHGLQIDPTWEVERLQSVLLSLEHLTQIEMLEKYAMSGCLRPFTRSSRLILPEEREAWTEARLQAIRDYPHG